MQSLPDSLAPFFQEYDLTQLNQERDAATIIERTLRYGTRAELRWLFATYPRDQIVEWVKLWGQYGLPAPHLAFWQLVLGLMQDEQLTLENDSIWSAPGTKTLIPS